MRVKINDKFELTNGIVIQVTDMAYDYNKETAIITYRKINSSDNKIIALYNDEFMELLAPTEFDKENGYPRRVK